MYKVQNCNQTEARKKKKMGKSAKGLKWKDWIFLPKR